MTARRLLALSVAAIVVIAVALWLANRTPAPESAELGTELLPSLREAAGSIDAVRIFTAGDRRAVELQRSDSGWRVTERSGYPVDESKLRRLLLALAQARRIEEKTANPENYPALGVEDVSVLGATGVRLELAGPEEPFQLIVGKRGPGAKSTYVRLANEPRSWLIDAALDVEPEPERWVDTSLLDIPADRIQSVQVTLEGSSYTASKASRADADFAIEKARGKKPESPSAVSSLATALARLTLEDVQPAAGFEGGKPDAQATFRTFDGLVMQIDGWAEDDKRYIALKASFDEELAQRFHVPTTPPEGEAEGSAAAASEEDESATHTPERVREEAETLETRTEGWTDEIPQYKYNGIFKSVD